MIYGFTSISLDVIVQQTIGETLTKLISDD